MIKDPKQIVTPFAFQVHEDLLGLPLATPKRRLAALLIDLIIASILTYLGNLLLATTVAILFFWIAVRTIGKSWWKNILRFGFASLASFFVFALALGVLETSNPSEQQDNIEQDLERSGITTENAGEFDWMKFGQTMASIDYTNEDSVEKSLQRLALDLAEWDSIKYSDFFDEADLEQLSSQIVEFRTALLANDSLVIDSIRSEIAPIIASTELNKLGAELENLEDENDDLGEENEALREEINNPSIYRLAKTSSKMLGLSLGWIGLYFIISIAFFRGQTLGKRLLNIRVVRLDNKPIGLLYSFERFGGYAAGVATGLLGFFQIYWDANRQAIHDKIAGTVVVDQRKSRIKKYHHLREEVLSFPEESEHRIQD